MGKTLIDCKLVLGCIDIGVGRPKQYDGKCEGYAKSDYDKELCEKLADNLRRTHKGNEEELEKFYVMLEG